MNTRLLLTTGMIGVLTLTMAFHGAGPAHANALKAPQTIAIADWDGDDAQAVTTAPSTSSAPLTSTDSTLSAAAAPAPIGPQTPFPSAWIGTRGRVLIADLSEFRLFAYEDGVLVHSSIIAHGRFNMRTLTGFYSVLRRAESADLTYRGNTVEDVPYILAYDDAFAIHGAYWHDDADWGTRASSGCINLPVEEAAWFYQFASIGTPVIIVE